MTDEQTKNKNEHKKNSRRPRVYDELRWIDFEVYGDEIDHYLGGGRR